MNDSCFEFYWHVNVSVTQVKNTKYFMTKGEIGKLTCLFDAINGNYHPIFIHLNKMTAIKKKYRIRNVYLKCATLEGFCVSVNTAFNFAKQGNLFECEVGSFISYLYVCNGQSDCPDGSDENSPECSHQTSNVPTAKCPQLYVTAKDRSCQISLQLDTKTSQPQVSESPFFCNDGKKLNWKLQNDLVADCGPDAEDENELILHHKDLTKFSCQQKNQLPCREGHSRCYDFADICVYRLNEFCTLTPCRTGEHVQRCTKFQCDMKFKCSGYYCIPWSYTCNGKWDCPKGYDELGIHSCGIDRNCKGMFKCSNSQRCIHVNDICDRYTDCVDGDDEFLCSLHNIKCPLPCKCITYTVECYNVIREVSTLLPSYPYNMIFIKYSSILFTKAFLHKLPHISILVVMKSSLTHLCGNLPSLTYTLVVDMSFNNIQLIEDECFENSSRIKVLKLNNNKIKFFSVKMVSDLNFLQYLDLSFNPLKEVCKYKISIKQRKIILKLSHNNLSGMVMLSIKQITTKILLTNDYQLCCNVPFETFCSAKIPWYVSCSYLLKNTAIKWCLYCVSTFIILVNFISLMLQRQSFVKDKNTKETTGAFEVMVAANNCTAITYAVYLVLIWVIDLKYGRLFVFFSSEWKSGICLYAAGLVYNFNILSPLLITLLSFSRLTVVSHPLTTRFKYKHFVMKYITSFVTLSVTVTATFTTALKLIHGRVPFDMCSPLVDPSHSILLLEITTWFIVLLELFSSFYNVVLHMKITRKLKESDENVQRSNKATYLTRSVIIQMISLPVSNVLCWVPSGVIYLAASYLNEYPIDMMKWTIIAVTTVNSIVNPLIYVVVGIRKG